MITEIILKKCRRASWKLSGESKCFPESTIVWGKNWDLMFPIEALKDGDF